MGNLIASWSPIVGKSGVTTTTSVLSTVAAITKPYASLLINAPNNPNILEKYINASVTKDAVFGEGIEGLKRLISSNLITPETVPDYAENILNKKLDIILGSELNDVQAMVLLKNAVSTYEYVWIDLKNAENDIADIVLKEADQILIHLPQNIYDIEKCLPQIESKYAKSSKLFYIVGNYDRSANLSVKNIKRKFKINSPIYSMTYSPTLKNAINSNNLTEFLLKVAKQETYSEKNLFVKDANIIIDQLLYRLSNAREEW